MSGGVKGDGLVQEAMLAPGDILRGLLGFMDPGVAREVFTVVAGAIRATRSGEPAGGVDEPALRMRFEHEFTLSELRQIFLEVNEAVKRGDVS